jgi:hypothetical protein
MKIYGKIEVRENANGIICGDWFGDQDGARAFVLATVGKIRTVEMFDNAGRTAGENVFEGSFIAR